MSLHGMRCTCPCHRTSVGAAITVPTLIGVLLTDPIERVVACDRCQWKHVRVAYHLGEPFIATLPWRQRARIAANPEAMRDIVDRLKAEHPDWFPPEDRRA